MIGESKSITTASGSPIRTYRAYVAHYYPKFYERDNFKRMRPETCGAWQAHRALARIREMMKGGGNDSGW